ncbi:MAG TPA: DUF1571 domain-containing protein [Gemmataceae bacterium]|nr:DUF1571 domain-containing protein [Gemmataceae bacterium]
MVGSKQTRRYAATGIMGILLTGCVGLGDTLSSGVDATSARPRPRQIAEAATPDLRIPADAVAQAPDIPLVPLPSFARPTSSPAAPSSRPPVVRSANPSVPPASAAPPTAAPQTTPPAAAPQTTPVPAATPTETPPHTARQLLQQAAARCSTLDSYIVRLTRREHLKDKAQPEETLLFKFRKKPFSVHFKWLGDAAKGREVVYVKGRFDNKIHTKVAAGDSMLLPAGARLSLSPDNPLVRSASRHPITDAGICHCVETLTTQLDAQERGDRRWGTLTAIAPQRRAEYPKPVETIERIIPPGVEPELPRGGRRLMCFDPDWQLPMLVVTFDDKDREVEYYRYDRMQTPVNLDDDDFNPDKLWAAPRTKPAPGGAAKR